MLSAAGILFWITKRRNVQFPKNLQSTFSEPPIGARPLFEPTKLELKAESDAEAARLIAGREYHANAERRSRVDAALERWRTEHSKAAAADLLRVAVNDGMSGDLVRAANEITIVFRENGISGLTSSDLAALLDSHMRLLSDTERSSGAMFWLRQEVAELRARN